MKQTFHPQQLNPVAWIIMATAISGVGLAAWLFLTGGDMTSLWVYVIPAALVGMKFWAEGTDGFKRQP